MTTLSRKSLVWSVYRSHLAIMAQMAGLDAEAVLNAHPGNWSSWRQTRAIRWRAMYLVAIALDVRIIDLAQACNMTKQAVSKALRAVEDERDDPVLDKYFDEQCAIINGAL